jgi:hypothetical protein
MYRVSLPYTTRTTGIDVFDTDNLFRQRDIDKQIKMLNQDDGTFLKVLDLWSTEDPALNPIYYWIEDEMLPIYTQVNLAAGYTATDTSIVVDDSRLFVENSEIHVPRTLENIRVTAVAYSTHTLTVVRGWNGTPAAALVDNDKLIGGVAHLPENGDANDGTGRIPGTEKYNFISRFSDSFKVSEVQQNSLMFETNQGKIGTIEYEVQNKMFESKRKVNKALIFQHRGTTTTSDGTIYCSQGFVHYIEDNVLNLGEQNDNLSWPIISDWLDVLFEPTASSGEKLIIAGNWLFGAFTRMGRDMGTPPLRYYMPEVSADMIEITTESGNTAKVLLDRHGFPVEEDLSGWGIVVDMAHVFKKEYNNEPMTWRQNVQSNSSHVRQDEYYGSFSLKLQFPSCHGYIRGAGKSIVD